MLIMPDGTPVPSSISRRNDRANFAWFNSIATGDLDMQHFSMLLGRVADGSRSGLATGISAFSGSLGVYSIGGYLFAS